MVSYGICAVEAVHYAPHGYLDVRNIDCDFLACSPYKFFGPHAGVVCRNFSVRMNGTGYRKTIYLHSGKLT